MIQTETTQSSDFEKLYEEYKKALLVITGKNSSPREVSQAFHSYRRIFRFLLQTGQIHSYKPSETSSKEGIDPIHQYNNKHGLSTYLGQIGNRSFMITNLYKKVEARKISLQKAKDIITTQINLVAENQKARSRSIIPAGATDGFHGDIH